MEIQLYFGVHSRLLYYISQTQNVKLISDWLLYEKRFHSQRANISKKDTGICVWREFEALVGQWNNRSEITYWPRRLLSNGGKILIVFSLFCFLLFKRRGWLSVLAGLHKYRKLFWAPVIKLKIILTFCLYICPVKVRWAWAIYSQAL